MLKIGASNYSYIKNKPSLTFKNRKISQIKNFVKYNNREIEPKAYDLIDLNKDKKLPQKITAENYNEILKSAHPDFYNLKKTNYNLCSSCFFRRGKCFGMWSSSFKDVIDSFKNLFSPSQITPTNMLIVGIGQSQEPFSYLAAIKDIIKEKKLKDVLNLHTIDIQGKPPADALFEYSFFETDEKPPFAASSFILDNIMFNSMIVSQAYRVNDEIFEFLTNTYNSNTSKWATRVQDIIADYQTHKFNVVSANNVLGYINNDEERLHTIKNILRVIKPKGILISDELINSYLEKVGENNNFIEIYRGIWQKQA